MAFSVLAIAGLVAAASVGDAGEQQSSRTDILLPAVPVMASFGFDSEVPTEAMTDTLFGLFQEHALLDNLSCRRIADSRLILSCSQLRREDVLEASFDGDSRILTLSLLPTSFEPGYQPDFEYFSALEAELGEALVSAFGAEAVVFGPERK